MQMLTMWFGDPMYRSLLKAATYLVTSAAHAQNFDCPEIYPNGGMLSTLAPRSWIGIGPLSPGAPLRNAGAVDGSYLGVRAELRGQDRQTKDGTEHRFVFGAREKWVYCGYGGKVELLHRVDATAQQCIIRYRSKSKGKGEAISVRCF